VSALAAVAGWPVDHAAAAVIGPDDVIDSVGDQARPYALASLTKPLAALATLIAVEEGALELSDPLGLAPWPAGANAAADLREQATLRHLLAHASGLGPDRPIRAAAPGTRRIYSNAGFDLLGDWVAQACGIPFDSYLRQAVFSPLGMTSAELVGSAAKDACGSVADYCAFVRELLRPSGLIHHSTAAELATVQFPGLPGVLPGYGSQPRNDWGLGVEIRGTKQPHWTAAGNSASTFGHFGRSGTMFWIDPAAGLGLVALADRDFGDWAVTAWPALSAAVLAEFG
jgi:CubicO group peptidase (beta-lactamase class C family)